MNASSLLIASLVAGVAGVTVVAVAHGGRPAEAVLADRAAAEAEVRDLERRARSLDGQADERRDQLRRRVRALYKLSNGGTLRLLADTTSAADLSRRHDALTRMLARDLGELESVRDESRQVDLEQARRQEILARALELEGQLGSKEPATGLAARVGQLARPVPGAVVRAFGPYREHGIEVVRRGAELATQSGQRVLSIAAGRVTWVGEAPGLGHAVALEHADGFMTLTARLRTVAVRVGDEVGASSPLGQAAGATVYLELAQEGTPIDPAPWLRP